MTDAIQDQNPAEKLQESQRKAVVLLSGGVDSTTCLAIAQDRGYRCLALSFNYGQRALSELAAAGRIVAALGADEHRVITLDIGALGGSALTDHSMLVPESESSGIPITYVPARNTIFLSYALALAEVSGAEAIFIGVNAVDYSGYPDCRPEFISAFETLAKLATKAGVEGGDISIETPLIELPKSQILQLGTDLGVDYALAVSCYQADEDGRACGVCDSCRFRRQGFEEAGLTDPTRYRLS